MTALNLLAVLWVSVGPVVYRGGQNAFRAVYYQLDPALFGRSAGRAAPLCVQWRWWDGAGARTCTLNTGLA